MKAKFQCPECKRPIISRRNHRCQYCGAGLPPHLLFSKAELALEDRLRAEAEQKRLAREKIEREEAAKRRPVGDWESQMNQFNK